MRKRENLFWLGVGIVFGTLVMLLGIPAIWVAGVGAALLVVLIVSAP